MTTPAISVRVKPRIMARGAADFCVGLFIGFPAQFLALFVLPAVIAFLLSRSWYVALAVPVIIYVVFLAFSVWSITLTAEGIHFHRFLGLPKFLPWSSISSVEVTPRWELIRHGWLWPLLPAREMTASLTSLHHYRIRWQAGFCYYPPADTEAFEQYVSTHLQRPVAYPDRWSGRWEAVRFSVGSSVGFHLGGRRSAFSLGGVRTSP